MAKQHWEELTTDEKLHDLHERLTKAEAAINRMGKRTNINALHANALAEAVKRLEIEMAALSNRRKKK